MNVLRPISYLGYDSQKATIAAGAITAIVGIVEEYPEVWAMLPTGIKYTLSIVVVYGIVWVSSNVSLKTKGPKKR